jgi:hypothetical protein
LFPAQNKGPASLGPRLPRLVLGQLAGITDPDAKRKTIGRLFIEKTDADQFVSSLQSSNKKVKVATTTLDEVSMCYN